MQFKSHLGIPVSAIGFLPLLLGLELLQSHAAENDQEETAYWSESPPFSEATPCLAPAQADSSFFKG